MLGIGWAMLSLTSLVATRKLVAQERRTPRDMPSYFGLGARGLSNAVPGSSRPCLGHGGRSVRGALGAPKKREMKGRTHDLIDNKGSIFGTHDVNETKADTSSNPRCC
jgi:hypothetical protein